MRKKLLIITVLILLIAQGCIQAIYIKQNNQPSLYDYVDSHMSLSYQSNYYDEFLSMIGSIKESTIHAFLTTLVEQYPNRQSGTINCTKAGTWLYDELTNFGTYSVSKYEWRERADVYRYFKFYTGDNIIAEKKGVSHPELILILSAHYDGNLNSQAALDNGAGVAALLTVAKALSNYSFNQTMRIIFFSGEEQGAIGSYAYAQDSYEQQERIQAVINADVIANNTYQTYNHHLLRAYTPCPLEPVVEMMDELCVIYGLNIQVEKRPYFGHSDDKAFDDYGYQAMQIFQSGNGMEKFFGSAKDTIQLINFSYLTNVTRCLALSLATFAAMNAKLQPISIISPRENCLYSRTGTEYEILRKGWTIAFGPFSVNTELDQNYSFTQVLFELITGRNEDETRINRTVIASYTDDSPPFSWTCPVSGFGWHTIRVSAIDESERRCSDEIEVFL